MGILWYIYGGYYIYIYIYIKYYQILSNYTHRTIGDTYHDTHIIIGKSCICCPLNQRIQKESTGQHDVRLRSLIIVRWTQLDSYSIGWAKWWFWPIFFDAFPLVIPRCAVAWQFKQSRHQSLGPQQADHFQPWFQHISANFKQPSTRQHERNLLGVQVRTWMFNA